jgi:serine/threonine protein kinase
MPDLPLGSLVDGRYLITKKLGRGGMGTVYKVVDRETEVEYAIKVLAPELAGSPEAIRDLKKEVATAQQLTHENLLRVNYLGVSESSAYLLMEFIDGEDLETYRARKGQGGKLSDEEFRNIVGQLLKGLDYLHDRGMVHLDIKPQNVMVSRNGEVKVTDFGISTTIKEQVQSRERDRAPIGTLCFMAPEQFQGHLCDRRTDIYALGIMFHLLLTGEFPFSTKNREEVVAWHLRREYQSAVLPRCWQELIAGCLKRQPENRFSTCKELLSLLERAKVENELPSLFDDSAEQSQATVPLSSFDHVQSSYDLKDDTESRSPVRPSSDTPLGSSLPRRKSAAGQGFDEAYRSGLEQAEARYKPGCLACGLAGSIFGFIAVLVIGWFKGEPKDFHTLLLMAAVVGPFMGLILGPIFWSSLKEM